MPLVSIIFGGLLIGLGLWGWGATGWDPHKFTAAIPAIFGAVLVILGGLGMIERMLKHAMHAAALLGLVGCALAAWRFIPKAIEKFDLEDHATRATGGMMVLCGVFVVCCIVSFIQARRRRAAREAGIPS